MRMVSLLSMTMRHAAVVAFPLLWTLGIVQLAGADQVASMPGQHVKTFKKYCFECHDSSAEEGGVNLEELSLEISKDVETAERWQKILNAINSGEMPPEDSQQMSDRDKTSFLDDLSNQMVLARKILSDTGGAITMRRLNRREYANTLESLLGVRPDISNLPDDQAVSGFDTSGASLFFSSDQLEQYLATANQTLRFSLLPGKQEKSSTVRIEPEEEYTPHYQEAVDELTDQRERVQAWQAQSENPPSDFGFMDEYQAKNKLDASRKWLPQLEEYLARPETKTGATLIMTIKQGGYTRIKFPALQPHQDGKYIIRLRAAHYPDAAERFHYLEFTSGLGATRNHLGWRKVTATLDDPQLIEFPIEHKPGEKLMIWVHQRSHQDRGDKNLWTIAQQENGLGTPPGVWIDWAELVGPQPNEAARKAASEILFDRPGGMDDQKYASEVLRRFATKAFRGEKPSAEYMKKIGDHYQSSLAKTKSPVEALVEPMSIILASPSFLYLVESSDGNSSRSLTDTELAVRLSYFLWSSPPDEELIKVANGGRLSDSKVLFQQSSRMLADARADEFVRGFVHQWLEMDRLGMFQYNGVQFPTFDNAVRESARDEIFQTVHTMIDEKLPLQTLLKSDFVVINDVLAGYYGLPDVVGHDFRKVELPRRSLRGGLLGTAAVLAMGSDGVRSSPVERGAWVLRHLLNNAPPPAPPNVPQLSRLQDEVLTARQLAQAHQDEPQCAQCHQKIDPVGFGLENFDASGQWRDAEVLTTSAKKKGNRNKKRASQTEKEFPIDPSGHLPGGRKFDDYFGLRSAVANQTDDFAQGLAESLIAYGLGRPYGFTDKELADSILKTAKPRDYELGMFIHALVQSKAFRSK